MKYRVITADNHIIEPPNTFIDRVPAKYRDQAPRLVRGKDGGDGWSLDGSIPDSTIGVGFGLGNINPGMHIRTAPRGLTWDEVVPGNYDGGAHIRDMESNGIDASVVYPQMVYRAYTELKDRELGLACLRAFNDWLLDEFCAVDPSRLIGMCMIPWEHDMRTLMTELNRILKNGAKAIFLPYTMDPPMYAPYWDPMWKAVSEAGAVASIHLRFGAKRSPAVPVPEGIKRNWLYISNIVGGYFSGIVPLTELIFTGVFDRFPDLKFVDAEVNMGWVPFWSEMMDLIVRQHSYWGELPMKSDPHDYVGKNVFVTGLDDHEGFRLAREGNKLIARAAMFSIDYPHEITLFPNTQKYLAELTAGLDEKVRYDILAGNAIRVFNLN
ncbi:MAG: amidohydrolase family protein, partial [Chloroflexota bacterium]|nr:amidohydrolase family protein [Chloroflexota bacterium]